MDPLGALLRWARTEQNHTIREQAEALGVSVVAISAWESGRERATPADLADILKVYGILSHSKLWWAAKVLNSIPPEPPTKRSDLAFVSYAHQEGAAECPCNECRAERFHANRCLVCQGSGLRPGFESLDPT